MYYNVQPTKKHSLIACENDENERYFPCPMWLAESKGRGEGAEEHGRPRFAAHMQIYLPPFVLEIKLLSKYFWI